MKKILSFLAFLLLIWACGPSYQVVSSYVRPREVNIGYGTIPEDQLTNPVSTVQINHDVPYSNIYEMIQGRCAGVVVSGNSIVIRGIGTITLSSEPLFVVDGVEMRDISHINPKEVKDIQILKDSAAAIYGSRGANGVILIILK